MRPDWAIHKRYWDNKIFLQKEAKYLLTFWSLMKNITLKFKTTVATFWPTLGQIGLLLILISGHTGCGPTTFQLAILLFASYNMRQQ